MPRKPNRSCLLSMALRNDHSFGMPCPSDKDILEMRVQLDDWVRLTGNQYRTTQEKENSLVSMRQLYEEATGQGFYKNEL